MKKWKINWIDLNGDPQTKEVQAVDIYIALTISALPYLWITSIREVR